MAEKTTIEKERPTTGESKPQSVQDAASRLLASLSRTGMSLAELPLTLLPEDAQRHMRKAGDEFTLGVAALLRRLADRAEDMARSKPS
jgi:hypothetical protein